MTKRCASIVAALGLVGGILVALPASVRAQDASDVTFFLRSAGCPSGDANADWLSVQDADEPVECFYTASGIRNEIGENVAATPLTADRATATRYWDALDGTTIVLDGSRPVTGEIYTSGGACIISGAPCSPAGLSGGEVILDLTLVGFAGGNEVVIGEMTETFQVIPGSPHLTEVNIEPDPAVGGTPFTGIELRTWIHGRSAGHGVIKTNDPNSSFISVPVAAELLDNVSPPGKNDPPGKGKKKGCKKGKGKKKGACPGKKNKAAQACTPYTPGELGTDKPTVTLTDEATEEAPVEQTVALDESVADLTFGLSDETYDFFNVQVDSKKADVGLYALIEFPTRRDYDINLMYPDSSYAARSHAWNTVIELNDTGTVSSTGHGGESTATSEKLVGIKTVDCGGWTIEVANWFGEGGELSVKLWLGDAATDPQAAGAEPR